MTMYFDEQTMNETSAHYEQLLQKIFKENEQLRKENRTLRGKNRGFRRSIRTLKAELMEYKQADDRKQHYRNGRRGTKFNG